MDVEERGASPAVVGVCGAGVMGAGIAQVFALGGHPVSLYDAAPGLASAAAERIERDLMGGVARGKLEAESAKAALSRLDTSDDIDGLKDSHLVIEAVVEDLAVKQDLFRSLEAVCAGDALLVTNTSTLSPTEVASVLGDPGRAAGVHFFNPAPRMRLVEVVPGQTTRPETVAALFQLLEGVGKRPVRVNEAPGGIVSRLQLLVRNEAVRMVAEGVATPKDIDAAMRLGAGWPMGPLELIDLVGVDMHVTNCDSLARELGSNRYAPHPLVRKLVRAGHLGKKTGRGFYDYDSTPAAANTPSPESGS